MRVLALGGAGGMGRHACRIVADLPSVEDLVVADLDGRRAAAFAAELGSRVRSMALDVTDARALDAALGQADVVMNTVGPFFRFGVPILTAALEAGCHYLDVCDDWEPTLEMLDLHDVALRSGSTAIIGVGASPGISNLLAAVAARELDSVHSLVTGWNIEAAQPERSATSGVSAALVHGIQQMTGSIQVVRDGRPVSEAPLRRVPVDYPGLGIGRTWTFGHPEPLTLARSFPDVAGAVNAAHGRRGFVAVMKIVRWAVDRHTLSAERAAGAAAWAERHLPPPRASKMFDPDRLPPLFGHATGLHRGVEASVGAALCRIPGTTMAALTGTPLAIALDLLAAGDVGEHGVFAPEAVIDPQTFFAKLRALCPGRPAPDEVISITRSWDRPTAPYRASMLSARRYAGAAPT